MMKNDAELVMRKLGIEARRAQRARAAQHDAPLLASAAAGGIGARHFEPIAAF